LHGPLYAPTSTEYGSGHELTGVHDAPQANPKKRPLEDPDPDFDWEHWANAPSPSPPTKEFGQVPEYQVMHEQQPNAKKRPWTGADPDFGWDQWTNVDDLPPLRTSSLYESNQVHGYQVKYLQQPNVYPYLNPGSMVHSSSPGAGLQTAHEHQEVTPSSPVAGLPTAAEHEEANPPSPNLGSPTEPENEVVPGPPSTPETTDPEHNPEPQSLSTAVHPEDLLAAISASDELQASIYAAKGKAKESRSISSTARDVGNAAQRELWPAERSLDPRE
jgi:hypothetical protein